MSKKYVFLLAFLSLTLILTVPGSADENTSEKVCGIYFTGVGCPHCAKTDPVILPEMTDKNEDFVVIEYEIYQLRQNGPILQQYNSKHGTGLGVPQLIFSGDDYIVGDRPILKNIEEKISDMGSNPCLTLDGEVTFENLNPGELPGKPKIWMNDRILLKEDSGNAFRNVTPKTVALSGSEVEFENALKIGGWRFQWDGEDVGQRGEMGASCGNMTMFPDPDGLKNLLTSENVKEAVDDLEYTCGKKEDENDKESTLSMTSISVLAVLAILLIVVAWGLKR